VTDETNLPEEPQAEEEPAPAAAAPEKHTLKESLREAVGGVVGIAVEVGSMISGESGELVTAEREVAEQKTEDFIDGLDGEE
jgi:hypothetical protein